MTENYNVSIETITEIQTAIERLRERGYSNFMVSPYIGDMGQDYRDIWADTPDGDNMMVQRIRIYDFE
jgi:hypothetical protein